jgi:hypothetical protein
MDFRVEYSDRLLEAMNAEPMRPTHRPVERYHESLIQFSSPPILTSQP